MFNYTNNINITLYTSKRPSILQNFNTEKRGGGEEEKRDGVGKLALTSVIKEEHLTQL